MMQIAEGAFQRFKPSLLYRCTLVVVSLAMILLPVLYVGLVGIFAYAVLNYAVLASPLLRLHPLAAMLLYFGPIFVGAVLIFFMVKPLFAPHREQNESFSLNHADAPELFALIGEICRALGAPIPSRVDVDWSVNASAGFRSGLRSIFGNDIVLCVGLPLVAGMNLSQFAGVIAHEYGHFSQGAAMRAQYIIWRINRWFFRVVYQRDIWDLYLIHASEQENQGAATLLIFWLARAGVAFGRAILWLFMAAGALLSSFMSRQMEFDADRYALTMSGTETFISSTLRLQQLSLGEEGAHKFLATKWKKEKKLFDQVPEFIVGRANEIPAESQEKHYARAFKRKTRLFDSHPSDAARMQRARAAAEPGIFHDPAPATSLFTDFPALSRQVTIYYYQKMLGPTFSPDWLVSTAQNAARAEHDGNADREIIRVYCLGVVADSRPLVIKESKSLLVRRQETLVPEFQEARRRMEELQSTAASAVVDFVAAEARLERATQAGFLLQAGFQFEPVDFGLGDNEMERVQSDAREMMSSADAALQDFENAVKTRLTDAMQLLRTPQMAALIPDAQKRHDEAREMVWVLSRLGDALKPVLELRKDCAVLEVLLDYRGKQPAADNVTPVAEAVATSIQEKVNEIQALTAQIRYPFHHATEQVMVNDYARNKDYHANPLELALREGRSHTQKLMDLHARLVARLIEICGEVERQIAV